ncbi:EamA family transporter RarD [Campylobacter sp. 50012-21]|uniref:EamA family transporter RarD n=1 Tax=Campylobacter magnus TaxID=3026462 RepID=UPI002360DD4B|nr:EamA family transporter RarD [Campylobacter magnus]MDD0846266.1 EamA family transporter RarD [Campylobacter magnus]
MNKEQKGIAFALSTFFMWGVFPIYFKLLADVGAVQVLAHRILWSAIILFGLLYFSSKLRQVFRLLSIKKVALNLLASGVLISINWGVFIWAVERGQILETSLGYFINPLFSILLGAIFLKERLSKASKISLFIVVIAICVQIYDLGSLPFVSLILPASFAFYGLIRKKVRVPSTHGLFVETMLTLPFALGFLLYLWGVGEAKLDFDSTGFLLAFSGVVTILPLLTFNSAAKYLRLSTLGFFQYLSPSISFLVAIFLYNEPLGMLKLASFVLIWASLAINIIYNLKKH